VNFGISPFQNFEPI